MLDFGYRSNEIVNCIIRRVNAVGRESLFGKFFLVEFDLKLSNELILALEHRNSF